MNTDERVGSSRRHVCLQPRKIARGLDILQRSLGPKRVGTRLRGAGEGDVCGNVLLKVVRQLPCGVVVVWWWWWWCVSVCECVCMCECVCECVCVCVCVCVKSASC